MILAADALGVNLVDFFGTRRARREPAILADHFDSANRVLVSGSRGQNLLDLIASNFGGAAFCCGVAGASIRS